MKWLTEVVGILLCVQGIGGAINVALDGSRSWFLVRYVLPDGLQLPAAIALAVVGAVILLAGSRARQNAK
jgi:hypothetical protein